MVIGCQSKQTAITDDRDQHFESAALKPEGPTYRIEWFTAEYPANGKHLANISRVGRIAGEDINERLNESIEVRHRANRGET